MWQSIGLLTMQLCYHTWCHCSSPENWERFRLEEPGDQGLRVWNLDKSPRRGGTIRIPRQEQGAEGTRELGDIREALEAGIKEREGGTRHPDGGTPLTWCDNRVGGRGWGLGRWFRRPSGRFPHWRKYPEKTEAPEYVEDPRTEVLECLKMPRGYHAEATKSMLRLPWPEGSQIYIYST